MPSLEQILDGLGTFLRVGGSVYNGQRADAAGEKTAAAQRAAGDSALLVADYNARQFERQADFIRTRGESLRQITDYNARQYTQRAGQIRKQGEQIVTAGNVEENATREQTAQIIGSQQAGYAAAGVMIDRGTPAAMQISTARQGEVDALRIRDNYINKYQANAFEAAQADEQANIIRAEGQAEYELNQFQEQQARDQAGLIRLQGEQEKQSAYNYAAASEDEGENARDASNVDALTSLITSPVATKWLTDLITGGSGAVTGGSGSGTTGTPSPVWDKIKTGVLTVGAGVVGGVAGQELGEELTGRQANNNWGAGIGGVAGATIGLSSAALGAQFGSFAGPVGALIGAALGGLVDAAFGGRSYSHNSGFFLKDLPAVKNDGDREKFDVEPFESGLTPVGFRRRDTKDEAIEVIAPFRALDKVIVDIGKEFGKTVTADYVTGYDEKGEGNGVFLGSAWEDGQAGVPIAQQLEKYGTDLLKSLAPQMSATGFQSVMQAGNMEQKLVKLREVLAAEAE